MKRLLLLTAALAALPGCFRLSDPVYAFRSLGAAEPEDPGNSLLFGSLEITGSFSKIDTILLQRVRPSPERDESYGATERILYRVLRTRSMKDGHFLIQVPPGVYEVSAIRGGIWGNDASFIANDETRAASRITITRPGIYDLGRLKLDPGDYGDATLSWEGRGGTDRTEILKDAVSGTAWARYLGAGG